MATSKLNLGIGIALLVAGISVIALFFLPPAPVEAPATPVGDNTTPVTDDTASDLESTPEAADMVEHNDAIRVSTPLPESTISSPLVIEGEARGTWFFEGDFPVFLTNWDGLIIAEGFATAEGEWMTEDYVPFTAELTFTSDTSVSDRASLILQKSNPSGLPEHYDAFEYTLYFE